MRRVKWAREHLKKTIAFWKQTLFSDETNVTLFGGYGSLRVFRGPNEQDLPQHLCPTVKYSQNVMVWGSFSYKGVGAIRLLEAKQAMNSAWYCTILKSEVRNTMRKHFQRVSNGVFQDDGAPCHRSKVVKQCCSSIGLKQLEWPGQSPDCNPIENLWSVLKKKVRERHPQTVSDLKNAIIDVWHNEISLEYCQQLVESMPRRLRSVIKNHGFPISY
jgi:transposase